MMTIDKSSEVNAKSALLKLKQTEQDHELVSQNMLVIDEFRKNFELKENPKVISFSFFTCGTLHFIFF